MRRVVLAILLLFFASCGAPLPLVIRDEMAVAPRGTATIVFFTDFQCPFCRRTHAALAPILAERKDRVRVVLRHVPLPSHPDARSAARAAICAEDLGGEAAKDYAAALFVARDLSEAACEDMAVERGIDRARFRACTYERATDARIDRDIAMFDSADGDGVPLLYVGRTRLEGEQPRSTLEAAIDAALSVK